MENSLLAKLPGELRNNIYELVLYEPKGFHFMRRKGNGKLRNCLLPDEIDHNGRQELGRRSNVLALTEICRDIRKESSSIFFGVNTFVINARMWQKCGDWSQNQSKVYRGDLRACRRWLLAIGKENASAIKRLVLAGDTWHSWDKPTGSHNEFTGKIGKVNNRWWNSTRKIENELFRSTMLHMSSVRMRIQFECGHFVDFRDIIWSHPDIARESDSRIRLELCKESWNKVGIMVVDFPTHNQSLARKTVEEAFAARIKMVRSHESDGSAVSPMVPLLLLGIESCRASVMRALRAI